MQLVKFDPLRDLQRMESELDRFWKSGWGVAPTFVEIVAMDMYEEDGNLVAAVNLPNFNKNEIKVTTDGGVLEVSAEHKETDEEKSKRRYFFRESNNRYLRRVALPKGVKTENVKASFKDGMLKVIMPMAPQKKAKPIAIK